MPITRELALQILKYLVGNPSFYFPFYVVCREYTPEDDDFAELIPSEDYETVRDFEEYQTFQLWENLQDLRAETIELMSKGFIEKIVGNSIEQELEVLAKEYRTQWNEDDCKTEDSEKFGLNEFIGGKAEGYEDALDIVRKHIGKQAMDIGEWYKLLH
jgi:hypothetical protein